MLSAVPPQLQHSTLYIGSLDVYIDMSFWQMRLKLDAAG